MQYPAVTKIEHGIQKLIQVFTLDNFMTMYILQPVYIVYTRLIPYLYQKLSIVSLFQRGKPCLQESLPAPTRPASPTGQPFQLVLLPTPSWPAQVRLIRQPPISWTRFHGREQQWLSLLMYVSEFLLLLRKSIVEVARDTIKFLTAKLWSTHFLALDIVQSWNIFTLHILGSMLVTASVLGGRWVKTAERGWDCLGSDERAVRSCVGAASVLLSVISVELEAASVLVSKLWGMQEWRWSCAT